MSEPIWHLDRLSELLESALAAIDDMDDSGMMAPFVDDIRKEVKEMDLSARHRTSLFYTTDTGSMYLFDGTNTSVLKSLTPRDRVFLMALVSMLATELT